MLSVSISAKIYTRKIEYTSNRGLECSKNHRASCLLSCDHILRWKRLAYVLVSDKVKNSGCVTYRHFSRSQDYALL